jgi:hypothetical protein
MRKCRAAVSIRPKADATYFRSRPEERELALRLDEAFDITHGNSWGDLSMWLADPKQHIRERFGFAKEVLVIYSHHHRTDARVLTAIENIARTPDFKHRIDRAVALVIHAGSAQDTEGLLTEIPDWIVVPFNTVELTDPRRGDLFIRSRLAQTIGNVDLFGTSSPITTDKYFFGRNELLQNLVTRSVERRDNTGLFGLRKTGKTSVLFAAQRRLVSRPILSEYIDCQNPGVHAARWWQVLENIAERCSKTLSREHARDAHIEGQYGESNAGARFTSEVRSILVDGLLEHIVLFFDEVEYITPKLSGQLGRHWDTDFIPFWQTIRAVHQETQGQLTFIVAGVNPASVTTSHFGQLPNPIFQLAQAHYLEPLTAAAVREMVRTIGRYSSLSVDEPVYSHLQRVYGGHPFLIRLACSEVWKAAETQSPEHRATVTVRTFENLQSQIRARLERPVKDILLSLVWWYPEEYDLLRILAGGDSAFLAEYLRNEPGSILQFARYGLLSPDGTEFAIADLREFLSEQGEQYKRELSPFTRGDMPPELLPQVPDLDLLGELFRKRSDVELRLRRVIITYLNVRCHFNGANVARSMAKALKPRKDRPASGAELFVGRTAQDVVNELFTEDLKHIVLANWDVFAGLFEGNKRRFEMNMDTLNSARRYDAHTKPIEAEEAENIRNSYSWLLSHLPELPATA